MSIIPVLLGVEERTGKLPAACLAQTINHSRRACFKCMLLRPWLSTAPQALPALLRSQQIKRACLHEAASVFLFISFLGATNQIPDCVQPTLKQNVTEPSWLLASIFVVFKSKLPWSAKKQSMSKLTEKLELQQKHDGCPGLSLPVTDQKSRLSWL